MLATCNRGTVNENQCLPRDPENGKVLKGYIQEQKERGYWSFQDYLIENPELCARGMGMGTSEISSL